MMHKRFRLLFFAVSALSVQLAKACDVCGCYMPDPGALSPTMSPNGGAQASWITNAYFAIAEQFTHFGTLQFEGDEVANPTGQYLDSSITQLVAGYNFTSRFALQLNVPLIYRSFERPEGFTIDRGQGVGPGCQHEALVGIEGKRQVIVPDPILLDAEVGFRGAPDPERKMAGHHFGARHFAGKN